MRYKSSYVILIFTICIGCSKAGTPSIKASDCGSYSTIKETFNNTLCNLRIVDGDKDDNISVKPNDDLTANHIQIVQQGSGYNISVALIVNKTFDRETLGSMVKIHLIMNDKQHNEIKYEHTVYITDVNDNTPILQNLPYNLDIPEKPCQNGSTLNLAISAIDNDAGDNGKVRFSMRPVAQSIMAQKSYNETFTIDSVSGAITLHKCLDYESNNYYQFIVIAQDLGKRKQLSSTAELIIRVKDVQDMPPFFTRDSYRITIDEELKKGTKIMEVTAKDGDPGVSNNVTYNITSTPCAKLFKLDASTGFISTVEKIDRDKTPINKNGNCILTIEANEITTGNVKNYNSTCTSTNVTITIQDIDDNKPVFTASTYTATVEENTPEGVPIALSTPISVSDIDQGKNAEIDISLNDSKHFTASPNKIQGKGTIMVLVKDSNVLDYENIQTLDIKITATGNNKSYSDEATVTITINDTNDNTPTFNDSIVQLNVSESTGNGILIGTVTANDADGTPKFNKTTYSIPGENNRFKVDNNTGEIYTDCTDCTNELDREKQSDFYMTLFATDVGNRKSSVVLHVTLQDVNDNYPTFTRNIYTSSISENSMKQIIKLEASDRDQVNTNNSEYSFTIVSSTEGTNFTNNNLTLDSKTGDLSLNTTIDFEHLQNLQGKVNITVEVTDKGNPPLNTTAIVKLDVQDLNDNTPHFNRTLYNASIPEDKSSNLSHKTNVTQVFATDNDVTEQNKKINYFKYQGSDKFIVDASSGIISIQIDAKLDREDKDFYNLTIFAIDRGSPPLTGSTIVSIDVIDVNDEKPTFANSIMTASVKENKLKGYIIYKCTATDEDNDQKLMYSIIEVTGTDERGQSVNTTLIKGYFAIHEDNGSVYVNGVPDRETAEKIILTIQVNDTKAVENLPQTDNATLTITLEDINDNKPVFEKPYYNISVREDARDDSQLVTIKASDKDLNRTIIYTLLPGFDPTSSFHIDNATGTIIKIGELDRETNDSVELLVVATDNGVPSLNSTVSVFVDILDFNDNPPVFAKSAIEKHMKENVKNGTQLVTINATDADIGPNKNVTFVMDDNEYFKIDATSGVVSVENSPDRETTSKIVLRITAKDNPVNQKVQKSAFMTITVFIDDVNDNPPAFDEQIYKAHVEEDKHVGSIIKRVTASDPDEQNTQNSNITYELADSFNNKFAVNTSTGDIFINSSLKDWVDTYQLEVIAFDQGQPRMNGSTYANITVTDKNLHKPHIIDSLPDDKRLKIYECVKRGTIIHKFDYEDADKDKTTNAKATFNISVLQDKITNVFNLTEDGQLILNQKLDVNQKANYTFGIVATDKGEPPLSSDVLKITIGVIDVNDHLPAFTLPKVSWSLPENTNNVTIGTVTSIDQDKDSQPCYNITSLIWVDSFKVGLHSGQVVNVKELDHEENAFVTFTVNVTDCSIKKNTSADCDQKYLSAIEDQYNWPNRSINVTIAITDINDNPPSFKQKHLATGMRRNTEADIELEVNLRNESYVSDRDTPQNGILSWSFSNYGTIFVSPELQSKINATSGIKPCDDGKHHILCVTRNGTIVNNKYFHQDLSGYFILTVKVNDSAGFDTANITIYLISDAQIVTMTIRNNKDLVASFKNELLSQLSNILGYTAVFDSLQDNPENPQSSDLKFHVVETKSLAVISGKEAIDLFDKQANTGEMLQLQNRYNVMRVSQQTGEQVDPEASSKKLTFILVAVSAAEALIITIIIFLALSARNKFRRKLKAAVINTPDMEMHAQEQKQVAIPGSNLYSKQNNPLLNADIQEANVDDLSLASVCRSSLHSDDINLDENVVDDHNTVYDTMEEKEVTMDMYNDDTHHSISSEDLLNATLNLHALRKSRESLDHLDGNEHGYENAGPLPNTSAAFINEAFSEDLESTEI